MIGWWRRRQRRNKFAYDALHDLLLRQQSDERVQDERWGTLTTYLGEQFRKVFGHISLTHEGQATIMRTMEEVLAKLDEVVFETNKLREDVSTSIANETAQLRQMIADLQFAVEHGSSEAQLEAVVSRAQSALTNLQATRNALIGAVDQISEDAAVVREGPTDAEQPGTAPVEGDDLGSADPQADGDSGEDAAPASGDDAFPDDETTEDQAREAFDS